MQNFLDTAAVVSCCELVLSCDTVIAHLAGSLNVPCWLALKKIPDWRWGLTSDIHLVPVRLFRQHQRGDWAAVVSAIGEAMNHWNS